ncbi:hypothetical protein [Stutzerimonas stutzeri]|uniref:hypothetical protein n=1 Tax=Stutzerimonas stutzeri TaxID=316 RepID=UPI00037A60A8|nr:hypothetical protein [Stutzerimonas stutzeri]
MNIDIRRHKDLIELLDTLYPRKTYGHDASVDLIRFECGQRSVVEMLQNELRYQEERADEFQAQVLGNPDYV